MALSWALYIARGLLAPERERALLRAQELCERLGDESKLFEALIGLALFRFNQRHFAPFIRWSSFGPEVDIGYSF